MHACVIYVRFEILNAFWPIRQYNGVPTPPIGRERAWLY